MLNWPIIPMVYNDSFTYMEWLGKLTYIAENHEERIDDCEKNIVDLWEKVNDHESRIGELEDWRRDTVDPFIVETNFRLGELEDWRTNTVDPFITETRNTLDDHENRITAAEGDIDNLEGRMDTAEDDIDALETWRTNTVDPFVVDIGPRMTTAETNITNLRTDLTAESSARRNADTALDNKINTVNTTAVEALNKVNRINIELENIGTVRYFMATATVAADGYGGTNMSFEVPDEDWVTCDVRFLLNIGGGTEFRVTGNITDTTAIATADNGKYFTFKYDASTKTITVNIDSTVIAAADVKRFDFILYKGALTEAAQDQADIDFFDAMDTNGDGHVDARDASICLSYYADASTGVIPPEYTGQAAWRYWANLKNTEAGSQIINPDAFPDFNEDGKCNAIDASALLSYYAWAATTDTTGMTGPQAMREYRTQREAGLTD